MIITLLKDSKKTSGIIKHLRFRLRDTGVDIKYRSDLQASVEDLQMFDSSGRPDKKVRFGKYNESLAMAIESFIDEMMMAYTNIKQSGMPLTYDSLRAKMAESAPVETPCSGSWLDAYDYYCTYRYHKGYITKSHYWICTCFGDTIKRFANIFHYEDYRVKDITPAIVTKFHDFVCTEYIFVAKYPKLYETAKRPPVKRRSQHTIANHLNNLNSFFHYMKELGEITSSPFDGLVRDERKTMTKYDRKLPVFLRFEELMQVRNAKLPEHLRLYRDLFYLQCLLGCRISDFIQITKDRVCVSEEGIPFFRYVPVKTSGISHEDVETPLLRSAVDILKKINFDTPFVTTNSKKMYRYNQAIRDILKYAKIDRQVKVWNEETRQNEMKPVYEFGSSKMCRKTHEDVMLKVQINFYTTGLHAVGSGAIHNYTALELKDRYKMMCLAFDEPIVYYDADLNEKSTDASRTSAS